MDPIIAGLTADLRALNQRIVVLGAQFLALKLRASAFVQDETKRPNGDEAAAGGQSN